MMKRDEKEGERRRTSAKSGAKAGSFRAIQSVERAMRLLDILADADSDLSLKDIAARSGLNASTIHHLLATMARSGLVGQTSATRNYFLGPHLTRLSDSRLKRFSLKDVAQPLLRRLNDATKESVHLMALRGDRLELLAGFESKFPVRVGIADAALHDAAHATASGKAILAWLPEPEIVRVLASSGLTRFTSSTICAIYDLMENLRLVRRNGYAVDAEEFQEGVVCVGSAIRDRTGAVVGAVSASLPKLRAESAHFKEVCKAVRECALAVSSSLGSPGTEDAPASSDPLSAVLDNPEPKKAIGAQ